MTRFRWRFALRKGRWHDTKEQAEDSAVREGLASYHDYPPPRVYLNGGVRIEERE